MANLRTANKRHKRAVATDVARLQAAKATPITSSKPAKAAD